MLINDAFEDLSHSLRVLLEANDRAHRQGLLHVDRAEAVGNIETALSAVLNAFHSVYDAMNKTSKYKDLNWYQKPELALMLVLRNARHHNHARKIRTMYSFYAQEAKKIGNMEMYVLIDFPAQEGGADTFDVYLSWSDILNLFSLPTSVTRIRESLKDEINHYLGSHIFRDYAEYYEQNEHRVFINVVPLIVNAGIVLMAYIHQDIKPRSIESDTFLNHFKKALPAYTDRHEVNCGPIALMP
ncbi:hypothetical protein JCM14469_43430 [Desulfatiferula olefinivorans]